MAKDLIGSRDQRGRRELGRNVHVDLCDGVDCPCYQEGNEETTTAIRRTAIVEAGNDLATWLDYYANVCKETKDTEYGGLARKAIRAWERLVPPEEV